MTSRSRPPTPSDDLVQPSRNASKAQWFAYRVQQGREPDVLDSWTKRELIAGVPDELEVEPEAPEPARPDPTWGPVEAATRAQLREARAERSALAQTAITLAESVDAAESVGAKVIAARELRMTLPVALALGNASPQTRPGDDDNVVVGADRLEQARRRSAGAEKPTRRGGAR